MTKYRCLWVEIDYWSKSTFFPGTRIYKNMSMEMCYPKNESTTVVISVITIQSIELSCISLHAIALQFGCYVEFIDSNKFKFIVGIWECGEWSEFYRSVFLESAIPCQGKTEWNRSLSIKNSLSRNQHSISVINHRIQSTITRESSIIVKMLLMKKRMMVHFLN